ncbi:MAG: LysR family transcriptional regulator [Pseudomonadota bacterium]
MIDTHAQLFLRVVEAGSLKAAAEQIGADPSAVSRKIASLEARLGVKLLERSTKRSAPTDAGVRYYEGMRRLIDSQLALEADVAGLVDTPTGKLRVTAPVDFGARFVAPVLSKLQDDFPKLSVELLLGSTFADLVEQGIDVAIRIGKLSDSSLIAKRLGAVPRMIVGAQSYFNRHRLPKKPEDLMSHDFIFYGPGQQELDIVVGEGKSAKTVTVTGRFTANSVTAIRTLVASGRGLHLGPQWAFEDGLADGSLTQVLPDAAFQSFPLHALYAPGAFVPAKIRQFIDRMARVSESEPSLE